MPKHYKEMMDEIINKMPVEESNLRYSVKFAYQKGGKIANAFYRDKAEAEKFMKSVIAKGGKAIMTTEGLDEKVADSIIRDLQKAYAPLKGKTISPDMANRMSKHLDGQSFDVVTLRQLMKAKIPFISTLARNKIYKKTGKFEEVELEEKFALYAIRPFFNRRKGTDAKKGDRVSGPMTYTQAVSKAKQMNVGSSVGGEKRVEVKPLKEEDDHEVSMAVGQVRVMKERLDTIMSFLSSKTDDYNIEGWVQSYITSAEETLTTIADYLDKNPEVQNESRASTGASHNINQDDVKDSDTEKEKELKIKLDKEKDTDALERQIINLTGQLSVMKQKLENEKNRVVKPEPNPDTGEVPLRTGLANAIMSKKGKSDDLVKKVEKPKEMKISGQSKIQVNPKADLGQYAGGNKVNTGNLH